MSVTVKYLLKVFEDFQNGPFKLDSEHVIFSCEYLYFLQQFLYDFSGDKRTEYDRNGREEKERNIQVYKTGVTKFLSKELLS